MKYYIMLMHSGSYGQGGSDDEKRIWKFRLDELMKYHLYKDFYLWVVPEEYKGMKFSSYKEARQWFLHAHYLEKYIIAAVDWESAKLNHIDYVLKTGDLLVYEYKKEIIEVEFKL